MRKAACTASRRWSSISAPLAAFARQIRQAKRPVAALALVLRFKCQQRVDPWPNDIRMDDSVKRPLQKDTIAEPG